MMFVWVEWICGKCEELHSARFDVIVYAGAFHSYLKSSNVTKGYYIAGDIKIDDVAYNRQNRPRKTRGGGSKVFVPFAAEIPKVIETVKSYMLQYYSIKKDTLTLEVCSA